MTNDITAVKKFYYELFGWTYIDVGESDNDYSVVLLDGKPTAGIFKLRDVKASGGSIYRESFDLPNRSVCSRSLGWTL